MAKKNKCAVCAAGFSLWVTGHYIKRVRHFAGVPVFCFLIDCLNIHLFVNLSPRIELSKMSYSRYVIVVSGCNYV